MSTENCKSLFDFGEGGRGSLLLHRRVSDFNESTVLNTY